MTENRQDQSATGDDPVAALARQLAERMGAQAPADGAQVDPAMVTALAGEVRAVGERVDAIGVDVAQLGELPPVMHQLVQDVGALSSTVSELVTAPPTELADWLSLGVDEAEERWREIAYWVENVLVAGYNLSRGQLPDCWPMHRTAMVHLSWMFANYRQAYQPRANPVQAYEWSTRLLRDGLEALRGDRVAPLSQCMPMPGEQGRHRWDATQEARSVASGQGAVGETDEQKIQRLREASAGARAADATRQRAQNFPVPLGGTAPAKRAPAKDPRLEAVMEQLAERKWWAAYLEQGREEDLTWRRERAAAEESAAR